MLNKREYAQRILSVLEEFSHDNVFAILNTIELPKRSTLAIEEFRLALETLIEAGYVHLKMQGIERDKTGELPEGSGQQLVDKLSDWFNFDDRSGFWTIAKGDIRTAQVPIVLITSAGLTEARRILHARGYRWWMEKGSN